MASESLHYWHSNPIYEISESLEGKKKELSLILR